MHRLKEKRTRIALSGWELWLFGMVVLASASQSATVKIHLETRVRQDQGQDVCEIVGRCDNLTADVAIDTVLWYVSKVAIS